jgi:aminopeptidase N
MNNLVTNVAGTVEIHAKARFILDSALFELFNTFTISEIRVNGNAVNYSRNNSAIKVPVNALLGQAFIIAIDYNGTPPNGSTNPLGGGGMTNASSPTWGNQVTWSLSEPFSAFEWFPCKQSLRDKADSCSVKLTIPSTCKAGANGILENIVDLGNGSTRYEWMHRHPIDYYLISVSIGEYVEFNNYAYPAVGDSILIQNYIYDNPNTLLAFQNDIEETVDFMELFSDKFGPYPFADEKYGHSMAPIGGGMEHQTMTTQGSFNRTLTAHELGHQWWGNHVTCASWADIWMNEGFASYSEYVMLENLYSLGQARTWMNNNHGNIMSQNGGSVWVQDSLNTGRIFSGRLSYDKGAAIIHTYRYLMNDDDLFFQTLRDFQVAFADSTAIGLDIRDAFQAVSTADYSAAFDQWYFGEGYPTYSLKWGLDDYNKVHLQVNHITSSSTPTFTTPLEIRFLRNGGLGDTIIKVDITSNSDYFVLEGMDNTTNLNSIDPNNWIINKLNTITRDDDLFADITESKKTSIELYPNPISSSFELKTNLSGMQQVEVRSMTGQLVKEFSFQNATKQNISDLAPGSYLMKIKDEQGFVRVKTLVKE